MPVRPLKYPTPSIVLHLMNTYHDTTFCRPISWTFASSFLFSLFNSHSPFALSPELASYPGCLCRKLSWDVHFAASPSPLASHPCFLCINASMARFIAVDAPRTDPRVLRRKERNTHRFVTSLLHDNSPSVLKESVCRHGPILSFIC